ncbi:unnamed protein product, partial [Symbiodinium sp. CCMP2456]
MELYKADPVGAASVHQPLLLKAQILGAVPALWRGGHKECAEPYGVPCSVVWSRHGPPARGGAALELPFRLQWPSPRATSESPGERLTFVAQTLGPGILEANDVPESVRRIVTATLRDTWFSEARMRTYSSNWCSHRMENLMLDLSANAQASAHRGLDPRPDPIPPPSWMDDLAIPLRARDTKCLLETVTTVLNDLWQAMRDMGLDINFSQGKTELLPVILGAGSRQARRELLCEAGAKHPVHLPMGHSVQLHVTETYVHLGAMLDSANNDMAAIRHRAALTRKMLGLLAARTGPAGELYRRAYMEMPRQLLRLVSGLSTQGLTDDDVCLVLGLGNAAEARQADLVRHLGWIFQEPSAALHQLWESDQEWANEAWAAVEQVAAASG